MSELADAVSADDKAPHEVVEEGISGGLRTLAGASALALAACGGPGGGSGSGGGGSPTPTPTPTITPITDKQASRFLSQAAIGYARSDIANVTSQGFAGWLNSQFGTARPQRFWDFLAANGYNAAANQNNQAG